MAEILAFAEPHLDGVVGLCAAEGWPSWGGDRGLGALTAPGAIALAAVEDGRVVGALVAELFARSGLQRIDLLSTDEALPFSEARPYRRRPGVRLFA